MEEENFTIKERILICIIFDIIIIAISFGYYYFTKSTASSEIMGTALFFIIFSNLLVLIFGEKAFDALVGLFSP